ncbi:hypothetical protein HQ585_14610 [candidate division KSB1 bacterium]|nr:hypothetical protein [candidate division KSB1 bacterium]
MNFLRRKKMAGFLTLLLSGLLLLGWIGSLTAARMESWDSRVYGGRIPYKTRILLNRLHEDLRSADLIINAHSDHLLFQDEDGNAHEFNFMYGALWQNDYPFMVDVKKFHFEFRDGRGNLLNANSNPDEIVTIGYVLHLEDQGKEVLANLSVRLSRKDRDWTENAGLIAAAASLN